MMAIPIQTQVDISIIDSVIIDPCLVAYLCYYSNLTVPFGEFSEIDIRSGPWAT